MCRVFRLLRVIKPRIVIKESELIISSVVQVTITTTIRRVINNQGHCRVRRFMSYFLPFLSYFDTVSYVVSFSWFSQTWIFVLRYQCCDICLCCDDGSRFIQCYKIHSEERASCLKDETYLFFT